MHNSVIDVHSIYDDICTVTKVNPFYMGPCNYIYDAFNLWMYVAFVITCCLVSFIDGVCHAGSWRVCWCGWPRGMTLVVLTWSLTHVTVTWHLTRVMLTWQTTHVVLMWRVTRVVFVGCHVSLLNRAMWHRVICSRFHHRSYYAIVTEHEMKSCWLCLLPRVIIKWGHVASYDLFLFSSQIILCDHHRT